LIESTKINFKLDSKFIDEDYIGKFIKKLDITDSYLYPLDKRFKTFEELNIAIKAFKESKNNRSAINKNKRYAINKNKRSAINTVGLCVRKYSTTIKNINFKDTTINNESI
jgi:hypothetical protein